MELSKAPDFRSLYDLNLHTFHVESTHRGSDTYYLVRTLHLPGGKRPCIWVRHMHGTDRITVESLSPRKTGATSIATGISADFQVDEAFADALRQLPILPGASGRSIPAIDVVALGAIYGGFSGFSRLFLRLEQRAGLKHLPKRQTVPDSPQSQRQLPRKNPRSR